MKKTGIEAELYFSVTEKAERLRGLYNDAKKSSEKIFFIVPSGLDEGELLNIIAGDMPFFGSRPEIMTVSGFCKELARRSECPVRVIDPPDHMLILRSVFDEYAESNGRENLPPGMLRPGFIRVLGNNIKELLAEDVKVDELGKCLPDLALSEKVFSELYRLYIEKLEACGLTDAAQTATRARMDLMNVEKSRNVVAGASVVFVGFLSFTGSQRRLIKELTQISHVIIMQPYTGLDDFTDGQHQLNLTVPDIPRVKVPAAILEAGSPQLEIDAIAREIALWKLGKGSFAQDFGELKDFGDIGITVQREKLRAVRYAFARYRIPCVVRVRGTAGETPAGVLPELIGRAWRSDWANKETSVLLADPLLFPNGAQYDVETFPEELEMWEDAISADKSAYKRFVLVRELCNQLEESLTPRKVFALWLNFLEDINAGNSAVAIAADDIKLDERVRDVSYVTEELRKKINALDALAMDPAGQESPTVTSQLDGIEALAFIKDWGLTATLPIQPFESGAVTLYAGIPPILASHRYWIMTNVTYDHWPGTLRESPLLCNKSKATFNDAAEKATAAEHKNEVTEESSAPHLPLINEEREQQEAIFRRLLATGTNGVIITRSITDSEGSPSAESPFVQSLFETDGTKRALWLKSNHVCKYPLTAALPDEEFPWFPDCEASCRLTEDGRGVKPPCGQQVKINTDDMPIISVSSVDIWNACPYKFWCARVLGLDTPIAALYSPIDIGIVEHDLWNSAFNAIKADPLHVTVSGYAERHIEDVIKRKYPALVSDPRLRLEAYKLRTGVMAVAQLLDEIETRAENMRTDFETERELCGIVNGAKFKGRADRIDYYKINGSDGAVILDYKLGNSEAHKKELQPAIYGILLQKLAEEKGKKIKILGFGWIGQRDVSVYGYFNNYVKEIYLGKNKRGPKETPDGILSDAMEALGRMADAVRDGKYMPKYLEPNGTEDNKACKWCRYSDICRRRELSFRAKKAVQEVKIDG